MSAETSDEVCVDMNGSDTVRLPAAVLPLHDALRAATRDVHERMHRHAGFAALQNDTIDRAAYAALLARLHGFYSNFEARIGRPPVRAAWLETDLLALGLNRGDIATLPRCIDRLVFVDPSQILGALYVVEGSTLGGRALARHLDRILGVGAVDGRRFFLGRGASTGRAWRDVLERLAGLPADAETESRCVAAAVATFEAFETWLAGWDSRTPKSARIRQP